MDIEHLVFGDSPARVGPFSHAVKAGDFLFITGQMPTLINNPEKLVDGGIIEQTHQVMKKCLNECRGIVFKCCICASLFSEFPGFR